MSVETYRRELAAVLDGKDPRATKTPPGSAVLVFAGEGTVTVQIHPTRVVVVDGGASLEGLPTVLVRATLADWLRACESAGSEGVDIYGDADVLGRIAKLMDSKRDAVAARFFQR
ncbi:MAG: hypothetical protein Q8O67_15800 [Deltaproteobacteria bacterium]|nr:hypothetical protein [Deltaproteobacteria bacterium]